MWLALYLQHTTEIHLETHQPNGEMPKSDSSRIQNIYNYISWGNQNYIYVEKNNPNGSTQEHNTVLNNTVPEMNQFLEHKIQLLVCDILTITYIDIIELIAFQQTMVITPLIYFIWKQYKDSCCFAERHQN